MDDELMTADEMAALLRVTPRFVRRLVTELRIEFVKVGRTVRFRRAAGLDYIERNRVVPMSRAAYRRSQLAGV